MSENVTIIFYPYIYNNKIDFAGKKTYTRTKIAVDVLSKSLMTAITNQVKSSKTVKKRQSIQNRATKLQIILNFTIFANRSQIRFFKENGI